MPKLLAALATLCVLTSPAVAGGRSSDIEDIDGKGKAKKRARSSSTVREVVRGTYVKANVGSLVFVGPLGLSGLLSPGTSLALSIGHDVIDKEKTSASVEFFFHQSLNNGAKYFEPGMAGLIQGDIHTFSGGLAGEYSTYLTQRLGLGVRAGGGITYVPLLMDRTQYQEQVLNGPWGNQPSVVHERPLVLILGGPTVEYYTKLSHFSIGADVSFAMYLGLDFGLDASGYLKYTF